MASWLFADARGLAVMTTAQAWTIKGVSDRTRGAVLKAAHAEGLTAG